MANGQRARWSTNMGFILAAVGSAIGLGNVWRFSYRCYEHGGGAFLVPYFIALLVVGIPLMLVEYGFGHRERGSSPLSLRRVGKAWEWGGWWMPIAALFGINLWYPVVIAWCVCYFFFSFNLKWADEQAIQGFERTEKQSQAEVFFNKAYLGDSKEITQGFLLEPPPEQESGASGETPEGKDSGSGNAGQPAPGADDGSTSTRPAANPDARAGEGGPKPIRLGGMQWWILLATLAVWLLCWIVCFRDVAHGIERACKVFMPLLFILTLILVGWSLTLPGAKDAIWKHYLHCNWEQINPFQADDVKRAAALAAWRDAFGQIFFTLSLGFGIMIAYASYLPRKSDMVTNAVATCVINCGYSFIAGFAVFGVVGYMAHTKGANFEDAIAGGTSLAFIVYPEAINLLPTLKQLFGACFFLVLILAGISSAISLVEAFACSITDKFGWKRETVVTTICVIGFLGSIVFCTQAGPLILDIVNHYVDYALMLGGLLECIVVGWIVRSYTMRKHLEEASGRRIPVVWDVCVRFLIPAFLVFLLGYVLYNEFQSNYGNYKTSVLLIFGLSWMVAMALAALVFTVVPWKPERLIREHKEAEDELLV